MTRPARLGQKVVAGSQPGFHRRDRSQIFPEVLQRPQSEHEMGAVAPDLDACDGSTQLVDGDRLLIPVSQVAEALTNDALQRGAGNAPEDVRAGGADHAEHRPRTDVVAVGPLPLTDEDRRHDLPKLVKYPPSKRRSLEARRPSLPGCTPLAEKGLHRIKPLLVHDGLMPTFVGFAPVADQSEVGLVPEQMAQGAAAERHRRVDDTAPGTAGLGPYPRLLQPLLKVPERSACDELVKDRPHGFGFGLVYTEPPVP